MTPKKKTTPTGGNAPSRWMLEGDAPEPQTDTPAKEHTDAQGKRLDVGASHTGTDPLGRAIGPAEDHREIKKVRNEKGEIVTPKAPKK